MARAGVQLGGAGRLAGGDRSLDPPAVLLWLGSVAWVVGYDTLYAIQDMEDDALVGVKSSARRLGDRAPLGIAVFYALALVGWGGAIWSVKPDWLALAALVPAAVHLAGQACAPTRRTGRGRWPCSAPTAGAACWCSSAMLVVGLSAVD